MNWSDSRNATAPRPAIRPTNGLQSATRPIRGVAQKPARRVNTSRSRARAASRPPRVALAFGLFHRIDWSSMAVCVDRSLPE